jgi:hypothetical protein
MYVYKAAPFIIHKKSHKRAFIHGYQYFINQFRSTTSEFRNNHYRYIQKLLEESEEKEDAFIAKLEGIAALASEKKASNEASKFAAIAAAASDKLDRIEERLRTYKCPEYDKDSEMKAKLREISQAAAKKVAILESQMNKI